MRACSEEGHREGRMRLVVGQWISDKRRGAKKSGSQGLAVISVQMPCQTD